MERGLLFDRSESTSRLGPVHHVRRTIDANTRVTLTVVPLASLSTGMLLLVSETCVQVQFDAHALASSDGLSQVRIHLVDCDALALELYIISHLTLIYIRLHH